MTPDGVSTEDWGLVHEAVLEIVNASAIDDEVLCAHYTERLFDFLSELEERYGRIPAILATRADFTDDPASAIALHEEALMIANDSTSTRLSLQSLIRLMIDKRQGISEIPGRLKTLERVTPFDGDSSDLEELRQLQSDFERIKADQSGADHDQPTTFPQMDAE